MVSVIAFQRHADTIIRFKQQAAEKQAAKNDQHNVVPMLSSLRVPLRGVHPAPQRLRRMLEWITWMDARGDLV